ncbi:MAG TPA: hypothetical protein VNN18_06260 [Candidatus Xenobia bacterium]|nr:hypothetical protein [Candidatus Xenobia bacterium]
MALLPNLGPKTRIAYVIFGLFWVVFGWYALETGRFLRPLGAWLAMVAGAIVTLEGASGF